MFSSSLSFVFCSALFERCIGNLTYWNEWFLPVLVGNPGQLVYLQIDTGSTDLVVYSAGCDGCPSSVNLYDCSKSKSCSYVDCESSVVDCPVTEVPDDCWEDSYCPFVDDYGGGAGIEGPVTSDQVQVGPFVATPDLSTYFGSILKETGSPLENSGIDGILGFAYSGLSAWQGGPIMDAFLDSPYYLYDAILMCLTDQGVLELGADYWTNTSQRALFQWTGVSSDPGWFVVTLQDAGMNNRSLGLSFSKLNPGYGVIVDSGTTLILVTSDWMNAYSAILQDMCNQGVQLVGFCGVPAKSNILTGQCFNMTPAQVAAYPPISMSFRASNSTFFHHYQFTLTIPGTAYVQQLCGVPGQYGFGIQAMDSLGLLILGDVWIQNFATVFDKNSGYIGFGPKTLCPKAGSSVPYDRPSSIQHRPPAIIGEVPL